MNIKVDTDVGSHEEEPTETHTEESTSLNGFIYMDMKVYNEDEESISSVEIKEEVTYEEDRLDCEENLPLHSIKNLVNQPVVEEEVSNDAKKKKKSVDFGSHVNIYQKENLSAESENPNNTEQTRYKLRTRASSKKDTYMFDYITDKKKSIKGTERKHTCSKCNESFPDKAQLYSHKAQKVNFQCLFCKKSFCCYKLLDGHSKECEQKYFKSSSDFKCWTCGECFSSISEQESHNCIHKEASFKCQKCGRGFSGAAELQRHGLEGHCSSSEIYICDICKQTFRSLGVLKKHIKAHINKPFQCQNCFSVFKKQESLNNHRCNSKSICNTCHVCEKKFSQATMLKAHVLKHEGVACKCVKCNRVESQESPDNHSQDVECLLNTLKCLKCGKYYGDAKKSSAGSKDNLLKCNDCKKVFLEVDKYNDHIKEKACQKVPNKKKFKYECDACGNKFMKLVKLKIHILNDHQGINYQCEKCGVKFTCEEDREAHVAKQDCKPEDPCTCNICNKVFAKKDYLKKHQYMHTNVLLKCKYCYCAFMKEKSYQKHMEKMNCSKSARKIRMAEFNYKKCRLCEIEFESEDILIEHFGSLHPGEHPHQCFCCDSCLPTFRDLQNHIHHHNIQKYTCNLCGKPYTSQEGFRKHRLKHKGAEFKCRFCDSEFLNESRFKFHEKTCKKNPESGYEPSQEKPKKKSDRPKQSRQLNWESRIIMKRLRGDPNSSHSQQEGQNENTSTSTFFDEPETESNVRGWFDDYYKTEEDDIAFGLKKDETISKNVQFEVSTTESLKKKKNSETPTPVDESSQNEDYGNGMDSESDNSIENSTTDSSEEEDVEDVDLPIDYNPKKCRLCVVTFNHEYELLHHFIKSHPGENAHKCPNCEVRSPLFAQLKEHMKTHGIGMGVYNCDNCSKKFRSEKKMKSHNIRCKGMNVETTKKSGSQGMQEVCKKCGKKFNSKFGYKRHKPLCKGEKTKNKTPEKINPSKEIEFVNDQVDTGDYQVTDEEEETPNENSFQPIPQNENLKSETIEQSDTTASEVTIKPEEKKKEETKDLYIGEPPKDSFPCRLCDKKFQYERGIVMHFKSTHPGHKPLICHVCNMHLADKLKEHLKTHGIGEEFICELCGKRFNQKFLSKIHEMWHEGIEYKCKNCKQKFLNKEKMDKHIGENRCVNRQSLMRLPCDICGKSYRSKFGLSKHYITHTPKELRPVKNKMNCEYCGKWFENNNGLQRHRRIHTGERPFCCRFCPKAFAQEGNCKAHERIHTGESKPRRKKAPTTIPLAAPVVIQQAMPLPTTTVIVDPMPYTSSINLFTYHSIDPNGTVH